MHCTCDRNVCNPCNPVAHLPVRSFHYSTSCAPRSFVWSRAVRIPCLVSQNTAASSARWGQPSRPWVACGRPSSLKLEQKVRSSQEHNSGVLIFFPIKNCFFPDVDYNIMITKWLKFQIRSPVTIWTRRSESSTLKLRHHARKTFCSHWKVDWYHNKSWLLLQPQIIFLQGTD